MYGAANDSPVNITEDPPVRGPHPPPTNPVWGPVLRNLSSALRIGPRRVIVLRAREDFCDGDEQYNQLAGRP